MISAVEINWLRKITSKHIHYTGALLSLSAILIKQIVKCIANKYLSRDFTFFRYENKMDKDHVISSAINCLDHVFLFVHISSVLVLVLFIVTKK